MRRPLLLAGILSVILFATTGGPWSRFVGHSHWPLVEWVPFSRGIFPFDIVANVAMFFPFGLVLAWGRSRRAMLLTTVAGALLSMSIELFQVYTHGRLPTMTDVLTNTCGTALGVTLAALCVPARYRPTATFTPYVKPPSELSSNTADAPPAPRTSETSR